MALIFSDRVMETTVTAGTGSFTLAGAVANFETFTSNVANASTCYYCCTDNIASTWEVGLGTMTSSTVLARTTVLASSNANALVSFASNSKQIYMVAPATIFSGLLTGTSGQLYTANGAGVLPTWQTSVNITPTGMISPYAAYVAPTGWQLCDGSLTSTAALTAAITWTTTGQLTATSTTIGSISPFLTRMYAGLPLTGPGIPFTVGTGTAMTTTATSAVISSVPAGMFTTNLAVGQRIVMNVPGIFPPNATISSINSGASTVTMSTPALASGSSLTFNAYTFVASASGSLVISNAAILTGSKTLVFYPFGVGTDGTLATIPVPNLLGRVPVGADIAATLLVAAPSVGATGGEEKHALTIGELAAHVHSANSGSGFVYNGGAGSFVAGAGSAVSTGADTDSTGSGTAHNNLQPFLGITYIIKN